MRSHDWAPLCYGLVIALAIAASWAFEREPSDINVALFATLPPAVMALLLWVRPTTHGG